MSYGACKACGKWSHSNIGVTQSGTRHETHTCSLDCAEILASHLPHSRVLWGAFISPEFSLVGQYSQWVRDMLEKEILELQIKLEKKAKVEGLYQKLDSDDLTYLREKIERLPLATWGSSTVLSLINLVEQTRGAATECRCASIQADDPKRHFKGCPLREPLEEPKSFETQLLERLDEMNNHLRGIEGNLADLDPHYHGE